MIFFQHDHSRIYSNNAMQFGQLFEHYYPTICPGSSDPFYIVSYYIKWGTTSWTHSICPRSSDPLYIVSY